MDYLNLGRSGLKVSRACLGTMNFGGTSKPPFCDETEARRTIDAFVEAGGNFIDTADVYTAGNAEEIVGRAIKDRRGSVVLATKAAGVTGPGPNDSGLSRAHLTRALEASLRRLGTDYVDLYQMHRADLGTPWDETLDVLAGFVRAGKVRYLGASNLTGSQIVEAQWAAARVGGVPLTSLQPRYSLISREIEADVLPTAIRQGLGTLTYGVLAGGVLSGKYRRGETPGAETRYGGPMGLAGGGGWTAAAEHALRDRNLGIAEAVAGVADELGATPSAVAAAWCLSRRGVTSVIVGPRTAEQLADYLPAFELTLPDEALKRLLEVSKPVTP
jgi:aryl-alcohol dehydrogenase-like predicted oxidoreductase